MAVATMDNIMRRFPHQIIGQHAGQLIYPVICYGTYSELPFGPTKSDMFMLIKFLTSLYIPYL